MTICESKKSSKISFYFFKISVQSISTNFFIIKIFICCCSNVFYLFFSCCSCHNCKHLSCNHHSYTGFKITIDSISMIVIVTIKPWVTIFTLNPFCISDMLCYPLWHSIKYCTKLCTFYIYFFTTYTMLYLFTVAV